LLKSTKEPFEAVERTGIGAHKDNHCLIKGSAKAKRVIPIEEPALTRREDKNRPFRYSGGKLKKKKRAPPCRQKGNEE